MKLRRGFVSNSSTSSFCIYGVSMDQADFISRFKALAPEVVDKAVREHIEKYFNKDGEDNTTGKNTEDLIEFIVEVEGVNYLINEVLCYKNVLPGGVFVQTGSYYDNYVYIGVSPSDIKDDETGAEFRQRVTDAIKKITGQGFKPGYIVEAWRDG